MGKLVDMTGIELEQCVIDDDELDNPEVRQILESDYWGVSDPLDLSTPEGVIEVPEDEEFIKEYIESDMDEQPVDPTFDTLLEKLDIEEPEVMPSAMSYSEWLNKTYYTKELDTFLPLTTSCTEYIYENYNTEDNKVLYDKYLLEVRKELREWWFNNSKNALFVPDSREAWKEGFDISYIQDPLMPENPIIKN
jgi:hypothetical protein